MLLCLAGRALQLIKTKFIIYIYTDFYLIRMNFHYFPSGCLCVYVCVNIVLTVTGDDAGCCTLRSFLISFCVMCWRCTAVQILRRKLYN